MHKKFAYGLVLSALLMSMSSVNAASDQADLAMKGEKIYQELCVHCHGAKGDGQGHLVKFLKIKPADLTQINKDGCMAKSVLKAVLGRHKTGYENVEMPLLKDRLSLEEVYAVTEYIETIVK